MPSSCCAIGRVSCYSKDKGVKLFRFLTKKSSLNHGFEQFKDMNGFITTTVGLTDYLLYQEGLQGIQMVPILYQGSSPSSIYVLQI